MLISKSLLSAGLLAACAAFGAHAAPEGTVIASIAPQAAPAGQMYTLYRVPNSSKLHKVYEFAALDTNGDGALSRSELPRDLVDLRMHFLAADWDNNHRLSPDELRMYFEGTAPATTPLWHAYVAVFD